jgi:hypothetical protein
LLPSRPLLKALTALHSPCLTNVAFNTKFPSRSPPPQAAAWVTFSHSAHSPSRPTRTSKKNNSRHLLSHSSALSQKPPMQSQTALVRWKSPTLMKAYSSHAFTLWIHSQP